MWKFHRYYLKEIGVNGLLTFVVLFGIALLSLLFKGLKLIEGGDLLDAVLTTILLTADIFPHLLTFSLMFGIVLTFARASQEREITAIRALGISPRVPMVAALLMGLLCSLVDSWALHYEIPWAHYHKYRVVADLYRGQIQKFLKSQDRIVLEKDGVMTWLKRTRVAPDTSAGNSTLGSEGAGEAKFLYHDVSIYAGSNSDLAGRVGGRKSGSRVMLITAEEASFETDEATQNVTVHLVNVYTPAQPFQIGELSITVNLVEMLRGKGRIPGNKDLRSDSLLAEVYRNVHPDPQAARYMVHRRASFALLPFLLAPIGFCIGVLARDRGRVMALSFCMIPLSVVYLADFLSETVMRHTQLPLVGWLPAAVILLLGVPFCWRLLRI
jgi:lipopolysaccharide export system permease protein